MYILFSLHLTSFVCYVYDKMQFVALALLLFSYYSNNLKPFWPTFSTLKLVYDLHVTWAIFVPIVGLLKLSRDKKQTERQTGNA